MDRKHIPRMILICACASLLFVGHGTAAMQTFVKTYSYQASELDSKVTSRAIALEQVKRLLLEELGTYLESHTEVVNYQLTKDHLTMLSAGVVRTEVADEKWDGHSYWLKAVVKADPDDVARAIDALRNDHQKTKELEQIRKKAEVALKEVDRLTRDLGVAKKTKEKERRYQEVVRELSAANAFEAGVSLARAGRHQEAVASFSRAIQLNPRAPLAFNNRGVSQGALGNHEKALKDFDWAVKLEPEYATAYGNRGVAYTRSGQYDKALRDYQRALVLNPQDDVVSYNLACLYALQKDAAQACLWLKKTLAREDHYKDLLKTDPDLDPIRAAPCFKDIVTQRP